MEIRCRHCGSWFSPVEDTLDLIEGGYIDFDSYNICDECLDLIYLTEFDFEQFSDADPGL